MSASSGRPISMCQDIGRWRARVGARIDAWMRLNTGQRTPAHRGGPVARGRVDAARTGASAANTCRRPT